MNLPPATIAFGTIYPALTIVALLGAAALSAMTVRPRGADPRGRLFWIAIPAVAALLACGVFAEAFTRGWVLSQAHLLRSVHPWAAYPSASSPTFSNPLLGDAALQGYPWLVHACEALGAGRLPLWNPYVYAGHPFAASSLPAVFSPFTWLACLAPAPWSTVFLASLKILASGLGTAVLARSLGSGPAGAAVAAVAGGLNPFLLVWLEDASGTAAALAPWVVWSVVEAVERPALTTGARVALTFGLLLVAGQPETAFKIGCLSSIVGIVLLAGAASRGAAAATLALGVAGGLLLSAVHVVPFLEYARESRVLAERSSRQLNTSYTPRRALVTAIVPDFFGNPALGPVVPLSNRFDAPTNYVEQVLYPGAATWVLASVGLFTARRRVAAALGLTAVVGLLLKFGTPGLLSVISRLPVLNVTPLGRFGLLTIVSVVLLAALGAETLAGDRRARAMSRTFMPAAITLGVSAAMVAAWVARETLPLQTAGIFRQTVADSVRVLMVMTLMVILVAARARGWIGPALATAVIVLLVAADLAGFSRRFRPLTPPDLVYASTPEIDYVRRDPGLFRVAGWGSTLPPNTNVPYALQQFRGYDSMNQRRYGRLVDAALGSEAALHLDRPFQDTALLDLLNVKYVFTRPDAPLPRDHYERLSVGRSGLHRNRHVMSRAILVPRYIVADDEAAVRLLASGRIDPRREVVLAETPDIAEASPTPDAAPETPRRGAGSISLRHYRDDFIEIAAKTSRPQFLVLSDLFFPGWVAEVDGRVARIHRANVAFRAVHLPPGDHIVRFRYAPRSFAIGATLTLLAAVVLGAALATGAPPWGTANARAA